MRVLGVLAFFVEVDLLLEDLEDDFEEEDDLLLTLERREVEEVRRRAGVFVTVAVVSRTRVTLMVSGVTESLTHTWRSKS